ncbi:bifunctional transaldolase/phosoglucose isomerase [Thermomicrobium sp. 4228-Ro]|uniref:bifunctional transaldolase/phosoglucose isomerase n=1 Tax=Thermomicrobium sp. 4228-Ro TaxID=2993937 RepID=UPI0022492650|nr:bifunctional transaldolase/phosoglucose isomerase [Thermomicrobium sp. 4228-Ro]MCX2727585.1 bifunctional transaldolase/phosoglucose isomerase [Thermomicrobium sp. 4228-Ro]
MTNPLRQLASYGQRFWLDFLSRPLITSGELARLIEEDGLRGVTSNPTIFDKAIAGTDEYDQEIAELAAQGLSDERIFEELAVHDVQKACDLLWLVYEASQGQDGFVSLELPPALAYDTERTIAEARRLFARIDRPNAMIKVPGTPPGIPAIEQLIADGVNVNVTLLFSLENYEQVMEAYLRGLERRLVEGLAIDRIASVASFFVSRVDTEVDRRLDQLLEQERDPERRVLVESLKGKAAIANAKLAYQRFKRVFLEGARFARLREHGAQIQRILWASTSTKNPAYSDVMYVEHLIGPYTVQTMAPVTVEAYRDHGHPRPNTVEEGVEDAATVLQRLEELGISYTEVTAKLQEDGVRLFEESYVSALQRIAERRRHLIAASERRGSYLGAYSQDIERTVEELVAAKAVERVWQRDASFWTDDPERQRRIAQRLGWLAIVDWIRERLEELIVFRHEVRERRFAHALLLGMGGSSLAPEVFQRVLGNDAGHPELIVLDTTHPDTIKRVRERVNLTQTLVIVSSKSGTTIETTSLAAYWFGELERELGDRAGNHLVVITDPGTPLEAWARSHQAWRIFLNPPDIGGRYSALSYFGLVPASVIGLSIEALLDRVNPMVERLHRPNGENPGLWLGAALATLAQLGRDKVTFLLEPAVAPFGDWLEQLLAESTGKQGTGLVPIVHEPHLPPEQYGPDRVFVGIDLALQPYQPTEALLKAAETLGHPILRTQLWNLWELGAEMLRWEFATAIAGRVLGIDPFDEPDVRASKERTAMLLEHYRHSGELVRPAVAFTEGSLTVAGTEATDLRSALTELFSRISSSGYLGILAFVDPNSDMLDRLHTIRQLLAERLRVATTLGIGPRYLHSIGQLYKGGPDTGVFLQLVSEPEYDLPIPGEPYSFRTLFLAQADGDFAALTERRRPVLQITLRGDPVAALERLEQELVVTAAR